MKLFRSAVVGGWFPRSHVNSPQRLSSVKMRSSIPKWNRENRSFLFQGTKKVGSKKF